MRTTVTRRREIADGTRGEFGFCVLSFALFVSLFGSGCGANENILRSGKESPTPPFVETKADSFEADLANMKAADFIWLYVIRRKDGGILDGEDKAAVRAVTKDANRRIVSDGGKAILIGSNYGVSAAGVQALKERIDLTDLSLFEQTGPTPSPPVKTGPTQSSKKGR